MQRRTLLRNAARIGLVGGLFGGGGVSVAAGSSNENVDIVGHIDPQLAQHIGVPEPIRAQYRRGVQRLDAVDPDAFRLIRGQGAIRNGELDRALLVGSGDIDTHAVDAQLSEDDLRFSRIGVAGAQLTTYRSATKPFVVGVSDTAIVVSYAASVDAALPMYRRAAVGSNRPQSAIDSVPRAIASFDSAITIAIDEPARDRILSSISSASEAVRAVLGETTGVGLGAQLSETGGAMRYLLTVRDDADIDAALTELETGVEADPRVARVDRRTHSRTYQIDIALDEAEPYDIHEASLYR